MIWAVTAYFNPQGYACRLANYREFRTRLEVPLLAVELGFNGRFKLNHSDAEILIRIDEGAVLWQKERLLNVGLAHLPDDCEAVLSIDCDVFFLSPGWQKGVLNLLEHCQVIQPFSVVRHLGRDWTPDARLGDCVIFEQPAMAAVDEPAVALADALSRSAGVIAPGYACIYKRELLRAIGFFDSCIVGGGDTAMASAGWGAQETVVQLHRMTPGQAAHYRTWAQPYFESVKGQVGVLDGALAHLWHGAIPDRQPRERHLILTHHDFEPRVDIRVNPSGAWEWNSDKPVLHDQVRGYFAARREDA